MYPYVLIFTVLWIASGFELFFKSRSLLFILSVVTIIFLCLRFETGFDWPAYKQVFDVTPSFVNMGFQGIFDIAESESKEPFFVFFVSVIKEFGVEFQVLLVICAILQVGVFAKFLALLKENSSTVFALSISWLLFTLYMSTLRQGLAVSFFLMFMIFMEQKKKSRAIIMLTMALLFQYSSLIYILMYLVANYVKWNKKLVVVYFSLIILALLQIDSSVLVLKIISMTGIEMINAKIDWYLNGYAIPTNAFELTYNILFSGATLLILYFTRPLNNDTELVKKMYGMSILFCTICLLFYNFPLLRNRVQYLALPFCYFFVVRYFISRKLIYRCSLFVLFLIINSFYFYLFLGKQSSAPFVPYQNYVEHLITGDLGDGAVRYESLE